MDIKKGVNCVVMETEDMPVDEEGNRADVVMEGDSIIKRMNLGVLYEQYYNAANRDMSKRVRRIFNIDDNGKGLHPDVPISLNSKGVKKAWEMLLDYYSIVSPLMYEGFVDGTYKGTPEGHVESVIRDGVYVWLPTHNPKSDIEIIKEVESKYPPFRSQLVYKGNSCNVVKTVDKMLIGSIYMILLEKTGSDWSGTSSAKLQHFGIPAKLTKYDKHSTPGKAQPIRMMGETEVRLVSAAAGSDVVADIIDQSNNPSTHKEILYNIYKASKPTHIEEVIDRNKHPVGNGRNLIFTRHIMECAGSKFVYKPEE